MCANVFLCRKDNAFRAGVVKCQHSGRTKVVRDAPDSGRVLHRFGAEVTEDVGAARAYNQAQPN